MLLSPTPLSGVWTKTKLTHHGCYTQKFAFTPKIWGAFFSRGSVSKVKFLCWFCPPWHKQHMKLLTSAPIFSGSAFSHPRFRVLNLNLGCSLTFAKCPKLRRTKNRDGRATPDKLFTHMCLWNSIQNDLVYLLFRSDFWVDWPPHKYSVQPLPCEGWLELLACCCFCSAARTARPTTLSVRLEAAHRDSAARNPAILTDIPTDIQTDRHAERYRER